MAVERGAHVVRTHDVAETADAARIGAEFARDRFAADLDGVTVEELDVTNAGEAARHLDRLGADASRADETTTQVFELSGLAPAERETLGAAAPDAGVTVAFGESGLLLAGTPDGLSRLRQVVGADASERLRAVLQTVDEPKR
jgi:dihydropteroate synthase